MNGRSATLQLAMKIAVASERAGFTGRSAVLAQEGGK